MDRVRLGRVLGRGARMAARTAMDAVEAASAPAPRPRHAQAPPSGKPARQVLPPSRVQPSPPRQSYAPQKPSRRSSTGVLFSPMRKAARSVSLEVTGSFFALFALSFGAGVARQWSHVHDSRESAVKLGLFCAVTVFFLYCAVSSFLRARRLR